MPKVVNIDVNSPRLNHKDFKLTLFIKNILTNRTMSIFAINSIHADNGNLVKHCLMKVWITFITHYENLFQLPT